MNRSKFGRLPFTLPYQELKFISDLKLNEIFTLVIDFCASGKNYHNYKNEYRLIKMPVGFTVVS